MLILDFSAIQNYLASLSDYVSEAKLNLSTSKDKKLFTQRKNTVLDQIQTQYNSILR